MKALITGVEGFVGPYLASLLNARGIETAGTFLVGESPDESCHHMDVTDRAEVKSVIETVRPDLVFHLAGFSSVAASFSHPERCMEVNVGGTRILLDAIGRAGIHPRVLVVNSAEVYGIPRALPITESHPLSPLSPYAESRVAQERICMDMAENDGLLIVISRSFNHTGPGQSGAFVLSSFAKQIALIEKGLQSGLKVGNLAAIRDFSDVRDVVNAYYLLATKGKAGSIYNTCSGKGYPISTLLDMLVQRSRASFEIEIDPMRLRPSDIQELVGDNRALASQTGWRPGIPIEKTLNDLLDHWRTELG